METSGPRDPMHSPEPGTAEVHAAITGGAPSTGAYDAPATGEESLGSRIGDQAQDLAGDARDQAQQLGQRATEAATQAREKAGEAMDRMEEQLERSGVLPFVRDHALPVLGAAFGLGFLLAGSGDDDRHPTMVKVRNQLKGAVMGGVSAAVAQEFRSLVGMGGGAGSQGGRQQSGGTAPSGSRPPSHRETF